MRKVAPDEFESFSAGQLPKDGPHPLAVAVLHKHFEVDASAAKCRSWDEFRDKEWDFIVMLGDEDLENVPTWPGNPVVAHWHIQDPTATQGEADEQERAFWQAAEQINRRINLMVAIPIQKLETLHAVT